MHLHVGVIHAVTVFASVIFIGFFWRLIAAHNSQNSLGQAMSFIY